MEVFEIWYGILNLFLEASRWVYFSSIFFPNDINKYQSSTAARLIKDTINQVRKFGGKYVLSCHYLNQIGSLKEELKNGNSLYLKLLCIFRYRLCFIGLEPHYILLTRWTPTIKFEQIVWQLCRIYRRLEITAD